MPAASEALSEIGLTNTEGKVLESLIAQGPGTGAAVAARLGLHKSVAYFVLEQLTQKGLVSFVVINKKREYRSLELELFKVKLEERKKAFLKKFGEIQALLLQGVRKEKKRPLFSIFEGWNGMRTAFNDVLSSTKRGEDYFVFAVDVPEKVLPRFRRFIKKFHNQRSSRGINCSILVSSRLRSTIGSDRKKEPHTTVRVIPSEYAMPMAANVYKNKVLMAVWSDPPLAIIIEDADVFASFKAFFRLLWKTAKS